MMGEDEQLQAPARSAQLASGKTPAMQCCPASAQSPGQAPDGDYPHQNTRDEKTGGVLRASEPSALASMTPAASGDPWPAGEWVSVGHPVPPWPAPDLHGPGAFSAAAGGQSRT
ncbi:hypothetical protein P7K49_031887 [Saguinus oedipus]|uniref:Uncharacterized protein n=1 Tax=Saguinus oedipus TaxID=9490 RepID=A0ABQ9U1H3_SAGOE|nr:hypothetical protein P7K49_031887 [Saguinus oedipus]